MLRLLGRTSSINVRKVLWTLDEVGEPFIHEDSWASPAAPTRTPAFLALNPNALVPVIEDEAGVLWESNTICRYLAGKHGRDDLLPVQPRARALVERWMDWMIADLNPVYITAVLGLVRKDPADADPAAIADSAERWTAKMRIVDAQLAATGAYIAGEAFTLADILIGLAAHRYRSTPIDHADLPALGAHLARLSERPAFAKYASPEWP
jgi:glutathione S-transferase